MNEARAECAAAHHKDLGFLITGGKSSTSQPSGAHFKSSTEITKDGVNFEVFTPLPIGLRLHCMVALDGDEEGDFFVGGGSKSDGYNKRAFIHKGNQWVEVKEMPTARRGKEPDFELHTE